MTRSPRHARWRLGQLSAVAVLATAQVAAGPVAVAAPQPAAGPEGAAAPAVHEVTLLTGDEVTYTEYADGTRTARVEAAARTGRPPVAFETATTQDGLFVYPSDAMSYVHSGALDRSLFNVTELVREGLADTSADTLPVLATYPDNGGQLSAESLRDRADDLPAARPHVTVRSIGGVGMRVRKSAAEQFWASVSTASGDDGVLRHGVEELTLDRKVRVSLDQSTRQVGAPTAGQRGLDGSGTTVAVVDTGIDPDHADFAGRIAASANFTEEADTVDRHGHGTHVASIAAGDGTASGGTYRGIAPRAKLLVAKVFDQSGFGDTSQVMAGMEWSAEQGADVVNLSLGAGVTDGTDPLAELVNTLTAKTGALFVVAAGNAGPGGRSVTTPGSATSALTVGAVDRSNELAWFSSRGPRIGDAAAKPEIVAPGVDVAAARAAGTAMGSPVDEHYTRASGTSMATPHVAGGAALLAQQHPDWPAARLKDTLVSTARDIGHRWFEQGAGLLDLARATGQPIIGPATADFGRHERTGRDMPPVPHELAYTNTGDEPLTIGLSLTAAGWNGKPAPAGTLRLADPEVTIPPGGHVTSTVALEPDIGGTGVYGGTIEAKTPDGQVVLRTPVSTYNTPQLFPVRLRVTDSQSRPASRATAQLIDDTAGAGNDNDPFQNRVGHQVDLVRGSGSIRLPAGTYSALGWVTERGVTGNRWSALSAAEVGVDGPADIALNAADAVPVRVQGPGPVDQRDRFVAMRRVIPPAAGRPGFIGEAGLAAGGTAWDVYATPAPATGHGAITLQDTLSLQNAAVRARPAGSGAPLHPAYDAAGLATAWPGEHVLPAVFAGQGGQADLEGTDVRGKIAVVALPVPADDASGAGQVFLAASAAARNAAKAGAAAIITYADLPGARPVPAQPGSELPQLSLGHQEGSALRARLADGEVTLAIDVNAAPEAMYNLSYLDPNGIPADHIRQVDPGKLVASRTSYHADLPGLSAEKTWYAFPTGLWKTQVLRGTAVPAPGTWTEYTGPGEDRTVWRRVVTLSGKDAQGRRAALAMHQQNTYRPGEVSRPDEHWFRAPLHGNAVELQPDHPARYPATAAGWQVLCSSCRGAGGPDGFLPQLQWSDGTAGHFTSPYENAQHFTASTATLFQGDREIPPANSGDPLALFPVYALSPDPQRYRLVVRDALATRPVVGAPSTTLFRHATRTDTEWTFTSARPGGQEPHGFACYAEAEACAFQPLIQLEHRLPLDTANQAPAGDSFTFETTARSHSGAAGGGPVMWLRMSYSTDEGATWHDAVADPRGSGSWSVTVQHPGLEQGSGFVWLRAEARDASGNTVSQTMRRAYSLKAPPPVSSLRVR